MPEITPPNTPLPFRVCEDDPVAEWYFPVSAEMEPENPWAGWYHLAGNARRHVVDVEGVEYTPTEARQFAAALVEAADHTENYGRRTAAFLFTLTSSGHLAAEIGDLPVEQQRLIRDAIRRTGDRYRKAYPEKPTG